MRDGMTHVAARLRAMLQAVGGDAATAPAALLSAWTSVHVFERVLSLEVAAAAWARAIAQRDGGGDDGGDDGDDDGGDDDSVEADDDPGDRAAVAAPAAPLAITTLPAAEQKKLVALLDELAFAIEDLVRTGLTSATDATRQKLDVSFKEASRMKLLRLGASLRYVNEEVGRFLAHADSFSAKRLVFFAHRSWLLARGIGLALRERNDLVLARLLMQSARAPVPVKSIAVVTLGVYTRSVQTACTFDFRLRVVKADDPTLVGRALVLGLVFGRKSTEVTAEAFLHLPQPQQFEPIVFTEPRVVTITASAIALDERGGGRLLLGPKATVTLGKAHKQWAPLLAFAMEPLLARIRAQPITPLDLPVEVQDEVVLRDWTCAEDLARATVERRVFTVHAHGLAFDAVIPADGSGAPLAARFEACATAAANPPLYGLVHYEHGRLVLSPLATVADDGPTHLMLSGEKLDLTKLLGTLQL
jgi:hypothetical protein